MMQRWIFSIITPVFSVTWSSEIILICWFAAQETFLIIINVENSCAASYFCGIGDTSFSEQHLFQIEIFCKIINVIFDQFNVSLMNKILLTSKWAAISVGNIYT